MSNRTAAPGTSVTLYIDTPDLVREGHVVETRTGRRYLVTSSRLQTKGKHAGRQHLTAIVVGEDELCPTPRTHRIRWYARGRGGRTRSHRAGVSPTR